MTGATGTGRRGLTRPVVFTGIALGTFVTVTAYTEGFRPPVSGLAALLAGFLTWLLLAVLAVTGIEALRRHHRAIGRHGWRYGKRGARGLRRGAATVARGAAARSRPWRTRLTAAAQARWAARGVPAAAEPEDPTGGAPGDACPRCGWPLPADGTCPACQASREAGQPDQGAGPAYSWGPADSPSGWPADDPETAHRWARHMSTGGGKPQVVTEYPPGGGPGQTAATYLNGKPAPDHTDTDGGTASMKNSHIDPSAGPGAPPPGPAAACPPRGGRSSPWPPTSSPKTTPPSWSG